MNGKVCLVTGGTSGIGLVAARELALRGGTVVIVGRDRGRAENAVRSMQVGGATAEFMPADLSSMAEARRLAREFAARHSRLDVLVNNAGAIFELRRESVEGIEMTLALNHLGPFVLTMELLPLLRASAPSRIVIVSSAGHKDVPRFDFEDPEAKGKRPWRGEYPMNARQSLFYALAKPWAHPAFLQYAHTKLANLLFMDELSRRLAGTGVTVNALHPGLVRTGIASGKGPYTWFMRQLVRMFGIPAERGAETIVYLASSPEVEGLSGKYFIKCASVESSAASRDEGAAARLWEMSEVLVRKHLRDD